MFSDFFNVNNPEYDLYDGMVKESVNIYGIPIKYLPQYLIDTNAENILGEDVKRYFNKAIDTKFYLQTYQNYEGQLDLFSKFGLQVDNRLTLIADYNEFNELLQTTFNDTTMLPKTNDLIYISMIDAIFEINYINKENISFYNFGKKMMYSFEMRKFEYSGETMATGDTDIDDINNLKTNNVSDNNEIDTEAPRDFSKDNPFVSIDNS